MAPAAAMSAAKRKSSTCCASVPVPICSPTPWRQRSRRPRSGCLSYSQHQPNCATRSLPIRPITGSRWPGPDLPSVMGSIRLCRSCLAMPVWPRRDVTAYDRAWRFCRWLFLSRRASGQGQDSAPKSQPPIHRQTWTLPFRPLLRSARRWGSRWALGPFAASGASWADRQAGCRSAKDPGEGQENQSSPGAIGGQVLSDRPLDRQRGCFLAQKADAGCENPGQMSPDQEVDPEHHDPVRCQAKRGEPEHNRCQRNSVNDQGQADQGNREKITQLPFVCSGFFRQGEDRDGQTTRRIPLKAIRKSRSWKGLRPAMNSTTR